MSSLIYSSSPHVRCSLTTKKIMLAVAIALLPACIAGCIFFGWSALLVLALSTVTAVASEFVYLLIARKPIDYILKQFDYTSVVTGLLIGMNLTANCPWYVPVLASIFAIVCVKMIFGGTGKNLVNPAIAGRIFAFISFGATFGGSWLAPNVDAINASTIVTGATPLSGSILAGDLSAISVVDLLLGTGVSGVIGETCKLALIAGGIFLVVIGVINFRWPLVYVATTGLVAVALNGFDFNVFLPSILSGGLMLGAIFMATDYVTSPNTKLGNYIYFVACGVLTAVLRHATQIEMVSFVILIMNLFVPLIDKYIVRRPFGYTRPQKQQKEGK